MGYIYKPKYKDKNGISHESNIYWIKFYQDGKPCRESSESSVEKEALALLKIREGEVEKGNNPGGSFKKVRYVELAEDFLTYRLTELGEKSQRKR